MEKLVCINRNINKEAIKEQYKMGIKYGEHSEIVRNNQYWLYLVDESNMIAKLFGIGFACDGTV